jgi:vanillate O-demethylase monooxygenase subunit
MWVRNAWYVAGWSYEFDVGRIHARTVIDQPVALYRAGDGQLVASRRCRWAVSRATTCVACTTG